VKTNLTRSKWQRLAACALLGCLPFFHGCDNSATEEASAPKPNKPLPAAASNLVASEPSESVEMPHETDTATEFPMAMDSFAGGNRPDLRNSSTSSNVIRIEKAPTITKPGEEATASNKPIEKDWDGTVLIPSDTSMSKAYTDDVTFTRIEAHPLKNGSLRVWVRIQNKTDEDLDTRVACNFKSTGNETQKIAFVPVGIPAADAVDVYFMSPMSNVKTYTILVR